MISIYITIGVFIFIFICSLIYNMRNQDTIEDKIWFTLLFNFFMIVPIFIFMFVLSVILGFFTYDYTDTKYKIVRIINLNNTQNFVELENGKIFNISKINTNIDLNFNLDKQKEHYLLIRDIKINREWSFSQDYSEYIVIAQESGE